VWLTFLATVLVATTARGWVAASSQELPACNPANFKIAIDVGHTPEAPGATSARGVPEYKYNLQLAKQIRATLIEGGFSRITLITARGAGRSQLLERTARADILGVNLFLSIHHDDVQDHYHQRWRHNGSTRLFSDKFSGYSIFVSRANQHFEDSLSFAQLLGAALMTRGMRYSEHHAEAIPGERRELVDREKGVYIYDQLVVLKFVKAPAVLFEAGIIVNRTEELLLSSSEGRAHVSLAVLDATTKFCTHQQHH
jgi:N-acetylmuramoyl-L-alanine amidase